MKQVHSYDKKTGEPTSWWTCCFGRQPKEISRRAVEVCECSWPCKHPSQEITLQCKACKTMVKIYV